MKDSFGDYFIYTDGSVSDNKAAPASVIDDYSSIERLPNTSSIFSSELHALYLALDRMETADDDERYSTFSLIQSLLLGPFGTENGLILYSSSCPQDTGTPSLASTVPREKNIILLGSQSYWHQGVMRRQILLPKLAI